jgi:hypothetical protein
MVVFFVLGVLGLIGCAFVAATEVSRWYYERRGWPKIGFWAIMLFYSAHFIRQAYALYRHGARGRVNWDAVDRDS